MDIPDYDKALYYTLWGHWDDLIVVMVRTEDDVLSKKIQYFLKAYQYSLDEQVVLQNHENLLYYIDHAMKYVPSTVFEI